MVREKTITHVIAQVYDDAQSAWGVRIDQFEVEPSNRMFADLFFFSPHAPVGAIQALGERALKVGGEEIATILYFCKDQ